MDRRRSHIAAYVVALLLVFVVGILLGRGVCAPPPEEPDEPDCPPQPPRVVEVCPEDEEEPPPEDEPVEPQAEPTQQQTDPLPDAPPPVDPEHRRRLLGWAQDQSSTLEGCPRDRGQTHRLGITLVLDDERHVDDVSISAEDDLAGEFRTCLKERMHQWELPEDIEPPGRELFFQLTL